MPGGWDDEELFGLGEGGGDDSGTGDGDGAAPDPKTPEGRRAIYAALAEDPGPLGEMARAALDTLDDRTALAARQEELIEAADALDPANVLATIERWEAIRYDGGASPDDVQAAVSAYEGLQDALRAQVRSDWQRDDQRFLDGARASMVKQELDEGTIANRMAQHEANLKVLQADRGEPLAESLLWNRVHEARYAQELQRSVAEAIVARRPGQMERDAAEAQAANDEFIDRLLVGAE